MCEVQVYALGDTIIREGTEPEFFYMIKSGKVKAEKKITVQQKNYYPINHHQWETQITEQKIVKHVLTLNPYQYFCENEII